MYIINLEDIDQYFERIIFKYSEVKSYNNFNNYYLIDFYK